MNAATALEISNVPAIVKTNLPDDMALAYVIQTNVLQRSFSDMAHSEKATVLKLHHKDMFSAQKLADIENESKLLEKSGRISDDGDSPQTGTRKRMNEKIGEEYGLDKNTVARYLRLSELIKPLLEKVDSDEIPFIAGVDLSFLRKQEQEYVATELGGNEKAKVNLKNAAELKESSQNGKLSQQKVADILVGKNKPHKPASVTLKPKTWQKYFEAGTSAKKLEEKIIRSIEFTQSRIPETISKYLSDEALKKIEDLDSYVIEIIEKSLRENQSE